MTEYTPTTWKMRGIYLDWRDEDAANEPLTISDIHEEFNRWLSELIRKEREEAWLEGWNTGNDYYGECEKGSPKDSWKYDEDQNPYSNGSNET